MEKTTVYLPADLKMALKDAAIRRGVAEAEIIRQSIRAAVATTRPRPAPAILDDADRLAERSEELLAERYGDQQIGLADASNVVLADRYRTRKIATLDHGHFDLVRPLHGGRFSIVP